MTVSMRVMSAGDGYRYLLKTVAAGDGDRDLSTPLTRYYAEAGTPPGFWIGAGVASLGGGAIREGDTVSEAQLQLLLGMGRDPVTGEPLGRAYPVYKSRAERIEERIVDLDPSLQVDERAALVTRIGIEEAAVSTRRAVAGYDFTFSVPKSVSVLWAVADAGTQALIAQAHHEAVAEVVAFMEREVAATRAGATAGDGAVAQVDTTGLIATGYDHYDSRAGDPHLHTHVVISNKVSTVLDGKWRSLDGRPMHAAVVALSELHEAVIADHLTRMFGLGWAQRDRGRDRNPGWDVRGVPVALIEEFSSRASQIEVEKDRLIAGYVRTHGRQPSTAMILRLRAQATLATRPRKQMHSLAELTDAWRARAGTVLGGDATAWARRLTSTTDVPLLLRADDVPLEEVARLGRDVVAVVGEKRSTWRRWNLHAEASRQIKGWRFATTEDREAITGMIADAAEQVSLRLTPPELAVSPPVFQRADGTSVFRPRHSVVYSSEDLLAAEDRLLELSRTSHAPQVDLAIVEKVTGRPDRQGRTLGPDQAEAIAAITVSGRVLDVLVGPAGAGKTTAMAALRTVWEKRYGSGSVVGLAPSAVAAEVLAGDLGIPTENTAKWLHDHQAERSGFTAGQLVILDEASLAGTFTLDLISQHAAAVGAKVLLVGDWGQLQSVDAGGAFSLLVHDRDDVPELVDIHRFANEWEKIASLHLRHGRPEAIDAYGEHERIVGGDTETMLEAAYTAWHADLANGKASILVAETRETVSVLNERARLDRMIVGEVDTGREVTLDSGVPASVGDLVITRLNNRRLLTGRAGWVRNGDRWTITRVHDDGSVAVRRSGHRYGASVVLPAGYVAEHLDLGYAVTAHRAQGITVDTAHAIIANTTTRENLYVALTRGRYANIAYVALDHPDDAHVGPRPGDNPDASARTVLFGALQHVGAEPSAHETIQTEQEAWSNIGQLAAEYETIAASAQHDRWAALIHSSGLTTDQAETVIASDAFGPLTAELRRAEAGHHNVDALLPKLVAARGLGDAEDIAAILHHRLAAATARPAGSGRNRPRARLIAGLIPEATGAMTDPMRDALSERHRLIEQRATTLTETAIRSKAPWTASIGAAPRERQRQEAWTRLIRTVAAYRDRYQITSDDPLGPPADTTTQRLDRARAETALSRARELNSAARPQQTPRQDRSRPDLRL